MLKEKEDIQDISATTLRNFLFKHSNRKECLVILLKLHCENVEVLGLARVKRCFLRRSLPTLK